MNSLYFGGAGVVAAIIFALYRWGMGKALEATMEHVESSDKSLQQQQTENEAKLAGVNKDLASLYDERKKLRDSYLTDAAKTDQEKADSWNKPPEQH
jgi:peptidoglycan hydrolase CwlO-like protein